MFARVGSTLLSKATRRVRRFVHPTYQDPPSEEAWFAKMPHVDSPIVFLGDSLTAFGRWSELFAEIPNLLNRGIPGNTTRDVLARIEEVTRRNPRAIFLMIGTNDLFHGTTVDAVMECLRKIVVRVRSDCPDVPIALLGVPPVREDELFDDLRFNTLALELNRRIKELAAQHDCTAVDFHRRFADETGQLRREFTYDGVHFSPVAYVAWADQIRPTLATFLAPSV